LLFFSQQNRGFYYFNVCFVPNDGTIQKFHTQKTPFTVYFGFSREKIVLKTLRKEK